MATRLSPSAAPWPLGCPAAAMAYSGAATADPPDYSGHAARASQWGAPAAHGALYPAWAGEHAAPPVVGGAGCLPWGSPPLLQPMPVNLGAGGGFNGQHAAPTCGVPRTDPAFLQLAAAAVQQMLRRQQQERQRLEELFAAMNRAGADAGGPAPAPAPTGPPPADEGPLLPPQDPKDQGKLVVVLDLDETLVRFREGPVHWRPHCSELLDSLSDTCEVVLWTASTAQCAQRIMDVMDPDGTRIRHKVFRSERWFKGASYRKDLAMLGRPLDRVVIVENSLCCVLTHPGHALLVPDYTAPDPEDTALVHVREALGAMAAPGVSVPEWIAASGRLSKCRVTLTAGEGGSVTFHCIGAPKTLVAKLGKRAVAQQALGQQRSQQQPGDGEAPRGEAPRGAAGEWAGGGCPAEFTAQLQQLPGGSAAVPRG
eukprot:TRINITY_DN6480_c0_g2_i2.p1 TRINITY_DN6480_c0_g2~~TRINITY_DN6480_c0_g2_i2.p1  ORF type:complete len:426 (+),score=106.19 TRINITY_DN6480_c0_g2_i2:142-1419(+)